MEITYTIEPEDLWRYNMFVVKRVPAFRWRFLLRLIFVPIALGLFYVWLHLSLLLCLLAVAVSAAAWIPFCLWSARRYNRKAVNDSPGLLGLHTLNIGAGGVSQRSENSESSQKWSVFTEIVQSPDHILFFLNKRYAVVVPKRAFLDPQHAKVFYEAAVALWKSAIMGDVPPEIQDLGVWPPSPRHLS